MWQKLLRTVAVCLTLLVVAVSPAQSAPADPAGFITDLGNQAINILQTQTDLGARKTAFSKLFTASFDVPAIAKFVLGRYWNQATPTQQTEYVSLFGQYVVAVYAARFSAYQGEQFKVLGSRPDDAATATVNSQIIRPNGGPPIQIGWQVAKEGDGYKITNVVVENISMALTQRQDFASVIERNNGGIEALLATLRQKVNGGPAPAN